MCPLWVRDCVTTMPHLPLHDLLIGIAWAAGALFGMFYVIQEYKSKATPETLKDNPRIKNLVYILGGGAVGTLVDWQLLSKSNSEISKLELSLGFAIVAVVTIIIGFVTLSVIVAIQARQRNKAVLPAARVEATEAVLIFLSRGYSAYRERIAEVDVTVAKARAVSVNLTPMIRSIVLAMGAERQYAISKQDLPSYTSGILQLIPPYVAAQLGESAQISTANYMRAIKYADATPEQLALIRFYKQPLSACDHILLLEQYPQDQFGIDPVKKFALPVHDTEDNCMLGAPMAFRQQRFQAVVTSRLQFPAGVPKAAQKEAQSYFKKMGFKSFLCVPMVRRGEVVGIVNVESKIETFDPRDERIAEVAESLQPFSTSLASIIG